MTFHKWGLTPRPSGGIYVNPGHVYTSLSLEYLSSDGSGSDGYYSNCITQGIYDESTRDYSPLLTLPLCFKLMAKMSGAFQTNTNLLRTEGTKLITTAWKTRVRLIAILSICL